jgi:hypothetical protein
MKKVVFPTLLLSLTLSSSAFAAATPAMWAKHPALKKANDAMAASRAVFENGTPNPAFADEALFQGHRKAAYEHLKAAMAELEQAVELADKAPPPPKKK